MNEAPHILGSMNIAIFSVLIMGLITFILRAFPVLVPRKVLESCYLKSLNVALPISVMTLLILSFLGIKLDDINLLLLGAKILALILVFISYHLLKNVFVSIIVGVASLNGLLYLMGTL